MIIALDSDKAFYCGKNMKAIVTFYCLSLLWNPLFSQCPTIEYGSLYLNKHEIDQFPVDYPNCTEIDATLFIEDSKIKSLANLRQIRGITGSLILRSKGLKTLDGLDGLHYVNGNIQIENMDSLEALYAFNDKHFTSVGGDIHFLDNPMLTTLEGFQYLTHIYAEGEFSSAGLWFFDNPSLRHVDELANLTHVGKGIYFIGCDSLESIAGLSNINELPDDFEINSSPILTELHGLHNLEKVNGNFQIDKTGVEDFDDLYNLRHIGGALVILFNDHLKRIDGLSNLDPNSLMGDKEGYRDHLEILFNPLLSECSIDAICNMLVRDDITFDIQYNAEGCNDDSEVLNNCSSTSVDGIIRAPFTIYPNPSHDKLIIESIMNSRASFFDLKGRKLMQLNIISGLNEYDISFLPSGKYIIRSEKGGSMKIIIQ